MKTFVSRRATSSLGARASRPPLMPSDSLNRIEAGGTPALPGKRLSGQTILVLMILVGLVLTGRAVRGQEPQPVETLRIDTNLISMPVIVRDRDGRYVPGLGARDFSLFDDGVVQPIAFFDNAEEPLNVVLILDTSRSAEGVLGDIRKAAKNFLKELRPKDRAMIVSVDYAIHKLSSLTNDRKVLEAAIKDAEIGEYLGTVLYDAVMEANATLQPITGRKAIILLTDGDDHGSRVTSDEVISAAAEADAMIYSLYYESELRGFRDRGGRRGGGGRDRFPGRGGRRRPFFNLATPQRPGPGQRRGGPFGGIDPVEFLTKLSEVTGGRFYRSKKTDLKKTFAMVADELRSQYRLGFYPDKTAPAGVLHTLKVKVDRPDVAIRSRYQYRMKQANTAGN